MTDQSQRGHAPAPIAGGATPANEGRRLTPVEIQQKEFRLAFRGYNEREVDQFLDEVTEEIARLHADNKRMREELELKGTVPLDSGTVNEADEILRRAREQASRIVSEAEAESAKVRATATAAGADATGAVAAATPGPQAGTSASGAFLARERDFLQRLAGLIQDHAHAVREDIRTARSGAGSPGTTATPAPPAAPPPSPPGGGTSSPRADAGPPTEAWAPPFAERDQGGEGSPAGPSASATTAVGVAREPRIAVPPIDGRAGGEAAEADGAEPEEGGDRSLRELFWGED